MTDRIYINIILTLYVNIIHLHSFYEKYHIFQEGSPLPTICVYIKMKDSIKRLAVLLRPLPIYLICLLQSQTN